MQILVVGGGGREHTIIKKLKENKHVEKIFALSVHGAAIAANAGYLLAFLLDLFFVLLALKKNK